VKRKRREFAEYDVFPTDVWVKRVMEELYFKSEASFGEIQEFARDYFGKYAGLPSNIFFIMPGRTESGQNDLFHIITKDYFAFTNCKTNYNFDLLSIK